MRVSKHLGMCTKHYQRVRTYGSTELPEREKVPTPHGTIHGYRYHRCRCDECSEVWRAWRRNWNAENKDKIRDYNRKKSLKRYGLTPESYDALVASQGGGCAICGVVPDGKKGSKLHIDHCHRSKAVRGLLCTQCNVGIGMLKEDPRLFAAAVAYLTPEVA